MPAELRQLSLLLRKHISPVPSVSCVLLIKQTTGPCSPNLVQRSETMNGQKIVLGGVQLFRK